MSGTNASELAVGVAALAVIAGFVFWRFLLWIKHSPVHPDPWDAATDEAVRQPDAVPVCHHCLTQVPPGQWFCETCGCAVGPYNNYMPYVDCFSEGEVFRNGVTDHMRRSALVITGYLLISFSYLLFAPIYWALVFRNLFRDRSEAVASPGENPAV